MLLLTLRSKSILVSTAMDLRINPSCSAKGNEDRTYARRRAVITKGNLKDQSTAEEIESKVRITNILKAYESNKRKGSRVQGSLLRPVYYNSRYSTWGTTLPMTEDEIDVHRLFASGITGDNSRVPGTFRPTYVLGKWNLNDKAILSVSMMHPAVATATVRVDPAATDDPVLSCVGDLRTVSESSTGLSNHGIVTSGTLRKVRGRFALRLNRDRSPSDNPDVGSSSFVNLSYTSLIFHVSIRGTTWTCIPSFDTLSLMRNRSRDRGNTRIVNGRLFVYGWQRGDMNDSHVKISHSGAMTFVGSPSSMPLLSSNILDLVHGVCSHPVSCVDLLGTLVLVSTADGLGISA